MKRTTIVADDELLLEARYQAEREGRSLSALVQDALREYVAAHRPKRQLSCAGIVSVPMTWTQEDLDRELIAGLDPEEGWAPDRPVQTNEGAAKARATS
jgi:metal-responsive CopG/Arc/MetJ family transcriptional regulator